MKKPPLLLLVLLLLSWGAAVLGWVLEEPPGDEGRHLEPGVPLTKTLNETARARRELRAAPVTYDRREEVEGRYISYNELGAVDRFSSGAARSYRQLLFDTDNYQLVVGARDHIYRLSLTGFHVLESAAWSPDAETTRLCEIKGQDAYRCHNFVTLLEKHGDRLLACGTYAFRPMCSWRSIASIATVEEEHKGVGQSPFDPAISSAYVMSADGSLFVGTSNDFHGRDPAVMRVGGLRSFLRTNQYDYKWLSQPTFVAAFESGGFVYFFLKENAVEYLNCGERVYPRIVRVCKDDPGGSRGHTDKWTTFLKARLDCSLPGHAPFYYDSLESVEYLPAEDVFYALFTTQRNGVAGSAVCAFNMTSINKTFDGPFKAQSNPGAAWTPVYEDLNHYRCQYGDLDGDPSMSSRASVNANKYQLMDANVQPMDTLPVYTLDYERLTHLAVDVVPTRQSGSVHVLYMAGADATIRKVSVVPRSSRTVVSNRNASTTCLLEVIAPFPTNVSAEIHTMKFLRETHSLYIGTEHEVVRLPVHRCHRYRSRASCLSAHDPYCGWDRNLLECSPPPQQNPFGGSWVQEVIDCPTNTEPVDGGWASWSPWSPCQQSGSDDQCQCRHRSCDAPAPARDGAPCDGHYTEVSNCTVHGGWTQWSAWSQCSASCGVAVKSRRRSCTNPAPQHGGRVCVGLDHNEIYCHLLPPCPVSTHLPVSGGWGPWSPWSTCSSECGRGTRSRTRLCNDPRPKHGGAPCAGCDEQVEECVSSTCSHSSLEEFSAWTPWLVDPTSISAESSSDGGFVQKRYRAQCKVVVDSNDPDTSKLKTTMPREERFCSSADSCATRASESSPGPGATYVLEGVWEEWSDWSACDRECGTGQQSRWRVCASKKCEGDSVQHRTCNSHPCKGEWSCWGEWSSCSPHCGVGLQRRRRECLASRHPPLEASDCTGHSEVTKRCKGKPCAAPAGEEGWGQWSAWSGGCGGGATFRTRSRDCVVQDSSICRGLDHQKQSCQDVIELGEDVNGDYETVLESEIGNSEPQSEASTITTASVGVGSLAGACVGCLFLGVIVGALGMHILTVRQRHRQVPSSPHYLSVKQNQYVTVPGTHWKKNVNVSGNSNNDGDNNHHHHHHHKSKSSHQLSGTPTATLKNSLKRQSSARDPYTTLPLKEIDTATIKRSTHSSYGNGHIRADLDSDTIFNF